MHRLGRIATIAVLLGFGAAADARQNTFHGGPYDGLRVEVSDTEGKPPYFLPGLARQNPPSAARLARIAPALEAARRDFTNCRLEEPFEFFDGTGVRVGVACGDRLTKLIVFRFSGDEIVSTQITDLVVPRVALAPPSGGG